MDRFQVANASFKVDGYFSMYRQEIGNEYRVPTEEEAFEEAKKELIFNLNKEIQNVRDLTVTQFLASKKKDFK